MTVPPLVVGCWALVVGRCSNGYNPLSNKLLRNNQMHFSLTPMPRGAAPSTPPGMRITHRAVPLLLDFPPHPASRRRRCPFASVAVPFGHSSLRLAVSAALRPGFSFTWRGDSHPTSYVPCPAHTASLRRGFTRRLQTLVRSGLIWAISEHENVTDKQGVNEPLFLRAGHTVIEGRLRTGHTPFTAESTK